MNLTPKRRVQLVWWAVTLVLAAGVAAFALR